MKYLLVISSNIYAFKKNSTYCKNILDSSVNLILVLNKNKDLIFANKKFYQYIRLEEDVLFSQKYKYNLAVIMFDIDHFKRVNDTHGHSVGDDVLIKYTKLIKSLLRKTDVFARVGGEELMMLFMKQKRVVETWL